MDLHYKNMVDCFSKCPVNHYNNFFYPNICHVCKRTNENLILCNQCNMISYCSDIHKLVHQLEHKEFCEYITQYLGGNLSLRRNLCLSTSEWLLSRYQFVQEIRKRRKLAVYEEQIIMFAKSCRICHRQTNLHACRKCYSDNYCNDHEGEFRSHHELKCQNLRLSLNLSISSLYFGGFTQTFARLSANGHVTTMESFLQNYVRNSADKTLPTLTDTEYFYSDYVTRPLTLYDGMKCAGLLNFLNMRSKCIVHVIAAKLLERKYVKAWELLLHLLDRVKRLTIVLIGPKLEKKDYGGIDVCAVCRYREQKLRFESWPLPYENYVKQQNASLPSVIIRFQAHFNNEQSWPSGLFASREMHCPFLLTAASQALTNDNVNKIRTLLSVNPVYNKLNNFKSLRPWRKLQSDDVGYYNTHVTVYRNLHSS